MGAPADPQLHRIERAAALNIAGVAAAAMVADGWRAALSVLGGALPVVTSYWAIRGGVDAAIRVALNGSQQPTRRASHARQLLMFVLRFAILAIIAYVMIVRLRAHPWWMLAGATSLVGGAAFEAARRFRAQP
jgi:hypothetical protein